MRLLFIITHLLLVQFLFAQSKKSPAHFFRAEAALVNGETKSSFQYTFSGGLQFQGFKLGAGVGLDYYRYRTVPVFITAGKVFDIGRSKPFIYLNGGRNYAWPLENQFRHNFNPGGVQSRSSFNIGWYGDAGLGVLISGKKYPALMLGLGYSIKTVSEDWQEQIYDPTNQLFYQDPHLMTYRMNRLLLKLGLEF